MAGARERDQSNVRGAARFDRLPWRIVRFTAHGRAELAVMWAGLLVGTGFATRGALAQQTATMEARQLAPAAIEYEAPAGCPDRSWFEAQLGEGALEPGAGAWRARVNVVPRGEGFAGVIELSRAESSWTRSIGGASCNEVLSALAMSASLQLESARDEAAATPPPEPAATPADVAPTNVESPPPDGASRWHFGAIAGGQARSGLSPLVDFSGHAGITAETLGANISAQSYALAFYTGGGARADVPAELGEARWDHAWWTIGARGCPWGFALMAWLRLEPCVALHAGRYAAGATAGNAQGDWFGLAELTGQLRLGSGIWSARLELGGSMPIGPLGVELEDVVFYRQRAGLVAGLSFGIAPFSSGNEGR